MTQTESRTDGAILVPGWNYQELQRFMSAVPAGYDTVFGFLAKHYPDVLTFMDETVDATEADERTLATWCREKGLATVEVKAPPSLHEAGVERVTAYPLTLLVACFNS
jgi:hypothetical protein